MMYVAVPLSDDPRTEDRLQVERPGVLRFGAVVEEVGLLDLTTGGCRFRSQTGLPLFARVSIGIGGVGHRIAHVIWRADDTYGCAFEEPIPGDAVISDAPDNLASILTATHLRQTELEGDMTDDEKLPMQLRVVVIGGLAVALWAALLAAVHPLLAFHL
jgi:hypothetical protein